MSILNEKNINPEIAFMPEEYFVINPKASKDINTDVLGVILTRAWSTLHFVEADGECLTEGFKTHHDIIMDALNSVSGQLEQAMQVINHSHGVKK